MRDAPIKAKLGDLADLEMGQSPSSMYVNEVGHGIPFLQGNAEFGSISPTHRLFCSRPGKLCEQGDILISVRAPVGALNKAGRVYCIGRGLAAVRFARASPEFGWHLLCYWARNLQTVAQGSTFQAVGKDELQNLSVTSFDLPEQRRIAEILDTADEAIQATKRLIEKLKAAKQGLLHDLLTRGLDAEGRLRDPAAHPERFVDSPLGRVPREWDVMTLGEVCERNGGSVQTGPFGSQLHAADYKAEGTPIITVEHLGDGEILHANLPLVGERDLTRLSRYGLQKGDLVFSRVGAIDRCAIVTDREYGWLFSGRCLRVRPGLGWLSSLFLSYQLNSYDVRRWILNHSVGSTMPCLNTSILSAVPIRVPQTAERNSIAVILGAQDALIRAEEAHRDKLMQLKKGLMEDLLTGRVRVKGWSAEPRSR